VYEDYVHQQAWYSYLEGRGLKWKTEGWYVQEGRKEAPKRRKKNKFKKSDRFRRDVTWGISDPVPCRTKKRRRLV